MAAWPDPMDRSKRVATANPTLIAKEFVADGEKPPYHLSGGSR